MIPPLNSLPEVIPLLTIDDEAWIEPLMKACQAAEISAVEIALRTEWAKSAVESFVEAAFCSVGVGTVTSTEEVSWASECGAAFGLAPWLDKTVFSFASELKWPFVPGIATPKEAHIASGLGCEIMKVFPVGPLGGVKFLSSLHAVLPNVAFLPTGGISESNVGDYLSLSYVPYVSGSWVAPRALMRAGQWDAVARNLELAQRGSA